MRDIELVRHILIGPSEYEDQPIDNEKILHHLRLMLNGNMLTAKTMNADDTTFFSNIELTSYGYDLLTSISNDDIWQLVIEQLDSGGLDVNEVPLSIIQEVANKIMRDKIGLGF